MKNNNDNKKKKKRRKKNGNCTECAWNTQIEIHVLKIGKSRKY